MAEENTRPRYELMAFQAKEMFLQVCDEKKWTTELVFALQSLRKSNALQNCANTEKGAQSIKNAITNVALTGTTLNPMMRQADLIPRNGECCLDFRYGGLIKVATDEGSVKSMSAGIVFTWDDFDFDEGTGRFLRHKPDLNPDEATQKILAEIEKEPRRVWDHLVCAYSLATLFDGTIDFVVLPKHKLWKTYQTSKSKGQADSPWNTWPEEMIRKTVIKYHWKTLPMSDRMGLALQLMNEIDGLDTTKQSGRTPLQERFGFKGDDAPPPPDDGPDLCPSCGKVRILGICRENTCPEGEPPPEG